MEDKTKNIYRKFCANNANIPLFSRPWYLDACCNDEWDVVLTYTKENEICGAFPYWKSVKLNFSFNRMPLYCPFLGPTIFFPTYINSEYKRNSFYFQQIQDLEKQLPKVSYFNIQMAPNLESWYPFFILGYQQTTRYTYVINHHLGIEVISANLKPQLRNVVTKKEIIQFISESDEMERFLELVKANLESNNAGQFFKRDILSNIMMSSKTNNSGKLLVFKNVDQKIIAGVFIVSSNVKSYCLLTAADEEGKSNEAVACLIWTAIQDAVIAGRDFDFEGSMLPGVEKFFRSFGGKQTPYHRIYKTNSSLFKIYKTLRGK